jgi:hypothetical protein
MESIQIEPSSFTRIISNIKIEVSYIIINTIAVIRVLCFDDEMNLIDTRQFEMTQPDYQLWQKDEDLIQYVLDKYNFSLYGINSHEN